MRLWLSVLAVTLANWLLKASGPLVLGHRKLPLAARNVVGLMAPVLLAALIVVDLGGPDWDGFDGKQALGVLVAGIAGIARVPILPAVLIGVLATVGLRLL
jgi:branched-subunit amino acid transport protein